MKITYAAFLLIQMLGCLALDESEFQLINKATTFCLVKRYNFCMGMRWTTGDRLLVSMALKCLGVQGKSVGSEISLYDCDENNELQKWECRNETLLALKGQDLYIELTADNTAVLSRTIGPNNQLTISGTSSGACSRTYRELYTIEGNANGRTCMFPFHYKDHWFSSCTTFDSPNKRRWCAIETKYDHELWGYCPSNSKEHWTKDYTTGAYYQLNTQSALSWPQAEASCKQQSASLLSITDPHQQSYVTALLGTGGQGNKLWTGMVLDPEHGWQWSNGRPYRYLNWDSGHPVSNPGHNCGIINGAVQFSWQSSKCNLKLGYICYSESVMAQPTEAAEAGFCSAPWIPYNGHCFYLNRTQKTWLDAQRECRKEGGDLVSIRHVEDQSFVISQLGYASTDELWIGLNDRRTEGLFDWSDHSTVSFTSWENGNPAVFTDQEDCVLIRGENGNWADRLCNEKHGFICMKTSASEQSGDEVDQNVGCKTGWKKHGSYCYYVGTETKTFDEAKTVCTSSKSYLADVSNGVDNAFLVSLVGTRPEKYFWLGLSNQRHIDNFVWTNKDSLSFTHWNAQMPGHQQGCVAMTTGIFAGLWDVLPCTNREKYICKHLAEGAVPTPPMVTVPPPSCAVGWKQMGSGNYCYKVYINSEQKKTWFEARDYCRFIGGDLVSIHSQIEGHFERRYERVWIGLSAPDPLNGYVWSDGSPVNYQNWEDGEPNNLNNVESCAELKLYMRGKSWNDAQCEKSNGWLCQIRAGVTPKPPPDPVPEYNRTSDGWLQWKGNEYYINRMVMAMEEARHFCQKNHGDLVIINSEAENNFLWRQISRNNYGTFWIGLTVDLDGSYEWIDGSQVTFQRWAPSQPDFKNYDENCAAMRFYDAFWHDTNCGSEYKSICKRSGTPPANTTVAPTVAPKGGCPSQWKKFKSKCYSITDEVKLTWDNARKQCRAMGGNLASIASRQVQVFLTSEMADRPGTNLWIGFRSLFGDEYFWTDGKPKRYSNMYYSRRSYSSMTSDMWAKSCVMMNINSSTDVGQWIPQSCNDTNGYVCLRNVDTSLPDSPEPTISTGYVRIFNDSVKVVPQPMNWDSAMKHCEGDGANLANLRNEWSQIYISHLALSLNASLWIGLNKEKTNGNFKYIDGWPLTNTQWGYNEPRRNRSCVYVDVDGKWKTAMCNETMNSVCMKSTDVPPTVDSSYPGVCPDDPDTFITRKSYFWIPFRSYCYIFLEEIRQWPDASASCGRHGGTILSIEDSSEQQFIQDSAKIFKDSNANFWIGLFKTHKGEWLWLDRTAMDYTNWGEGQPIADSYGVFDASDGTWRASSQWHYRPYICKTPKVLLTTPSPLPAIFDPRHPGHIPLIVGLVITGIAIMAVIAFLYKKNGHHLHIPDKLTAFDNPMFFSNDKSQPALVDTSKLVENAEEENPEPNITV